MSFQSLLAQHKPLICPSAHDALSARLIELAGFKAIAVGGLSMLASQQAIPDIGLAALADMVAGARCVMRGTALPFGMDADDGFGDVKHVIRTVQAFAGIGAGQLVLEDQLRAGKKPGDMQAIGVASIADMQTKLRAALHARGAGDLQIVARTDAFPTEGLDGALRRAEAYLAVGADAIFISGLPTVEMLGRAGDALRGSIQVTVVTERLINRWPTPAELYSMGFAQVAYPNLLISRVTDAMQSGLAGLTDLAAGRVKPQDMSTYAEIAAELQNMLGLRDWLALEDRFS
ncbi:MAG TPA: isocitrate lyase/PEP mutase family protein [Stellaceae bacterium]|nr:isocitrate lyase/PEP mutase family protein [Stellaceae bacterium]